jgi:hypothetical protein
MLLLDADAPSFRFLRGARMVVAGSAVFISPYR